MANKSVKKNEWGQKCVNYLDLPVCPNCGSPNLHELEKRGNVTNCKCDRCDTKCWFDDSFSTEGRETMRYTDNLKIIESTKKSQPATQSFNDMVKKQRNKSITTDGDGWRFYMSQMFGQYIDSNSSENDFTILNEKICFGTPEEVLDQCKAIKGLMDMMMRTVTEQTGVR